MARRVVLNGSYGVVCLQAHACDGLGFSGRGGRGGTQEADGGIDPRVFVVGLLNSEAGMVAQPLGGKRSGSV